jgi:hypothetical protein
LHSSATASALLGDVCGWDTIYLGDKGAGIPYNIIVIPARLRASLNPPKSRGGGYVSLLVNSFYGFLLNSALEYIKKGVKKQLLFHPSLRSFLA